MGRLAAAEDYYETAGFVRTAVPWVVPDRAYRPTLPPGPEAYATLGGNLVASGEQSFVEMLLSGETLTRRQCTTPCFRDEEHDELHDPYFMKVELIQTDDTTDRALDELIECAASFYRQFLNVDVTLAEGGEYDLVDRRGQIELGSYGRRHQSGHTWLFGTGLAEPRLSYVLDTHWAR